MNYTDDDDYKLNPYYAPDKLGLEIIDGMDYRNESWQFDLIYVWREIATGKLYYATDSGCSCPDPFAGFRIADLHELESWDSLIPLLDGLIGAEPDEDYYNSLTPDEWSQLKGRANDLVAKVREASRG